MIEKIGTISGKKFLLIEKYNGEVILQNENSVFMEFKDRNEMNEVFSAAITALPAINGKDLRNKKIDYMDMMGGTIG